MTDWQRSALAQTMRHRMVSPTCPKDHRFAVSRDVLDSINGLTLPGFTEYLRTRAKVCFFGFRVEEVEAPEGTIILEHVNPRKAAPSPLSE